MFKSKMTTLATASALAVLASFPAAAASFLGAGNNYAAVTSEQSAPSTWTPALEVRVAGVTNVHSVGEVAPDGTVLTKTVLFDADARTDWAQSVYATEMAAINATDRGGWVDMDGDGILDDGEE